MAWRIIFVIFSAVFLNAFPASAQVFGSVHCKASLRKLEGDLVGAQRKVDATTQAAVETRCEALNVRKFMLEEAARIYGRCTEGGEREQKLAQADESAAEIRIEIERTCGG